MQRVTVLDLVVATALVAFHFIIVNLAVALRKGKVKRCSTPIWFTDRTKGFLFAHERHERTRVECGYVLMRMAEENTAPVYWLRKCKREYDEAGWSLVFFCPNMTNCIH